jgi:hypothetical protein
MARMSDIAWLMGAAALLLGGCLGSTNSGSSAGAGQQQAASTTAICTGSFRAFGEAASQSVSLTCSGIERQYVAYPESIAHRYSPCSYTFDTAGSTGSGRMTCSSGRSGPLTYDMTDPANIKVAATLDDGRQMAFTLRDQ